MQHSKKISSLANAVYRSSINSFSPIEQDGCLNLGSHFRIILQLASNIPIWKLRQCIRNWSLLFKLFKHSEN